MLHRTLALFAAPLLLAGFASDIQAKAAPKVTAPAAVYPAGMVSAADPRGAEAGIEMLRAGGSATDAALATLLALGVVEPQSSGIGGGGFQLSDSGAGTETIDGREKAPKAAHPGWFQVDGQQLTFPTVIPGGLSTGVPGNVALMALAHARHGKLPWKTLFNPAIKLAREGFQVTPRLNDALARSKDTAGLTAEGRALYYEADGSPKAVGTTIRNPAMAAFLTRLAAKGPKAFYRGSNAAMIAKTVSTASVHPAPMTTADLAAYEAKSRPPVCAGYRGYKLCGMGPPSSGANIVLGTLGLLERFDIGGLGRDSPVAWHLIAEAERLAYADRERYLADADFIPVPVAGLLAPDYIAARSQLIAADRTIPRAEAGMPAGAPLALADGLVPEIKSTTHFVAIDKAGNVVTETSTIESAFGSGLMANGYFLNNELTDFSLIGAKDGKPVANRVEGGKRPRSSMAPTLVYGPDGKLRLAVGAAGGSTIPAQVLKAIIGVIDWKLSAQDAIALPVIYAPGGETVYVEKGTAMEGMIPALLALGHKSVVAREPSFKANAIEVVGGRLVGAYDPRSEGKAIVE